MTPAAARMTGPSRGRRAAMMPSGIATSDRRRQRDPHQREVFAQPPEQATDEASVHDLRVDPELRGEEIGRDAVLGHVIDLRPGVHPGHLRRGDPPFQPRRAPQRPPAIAPAGRLDRATRIHTTGKNRGRRPARAACTA